MGFKRMNRAGGGNAKPSQLPVAGGRKNPVAVTVQRATVARFPPGARLGKGARDGTALVCGVPRGCFPLGRIPQGGTPLRRGFRGETPAGRSPPGVKQGF